MDIYINAEDAGGSYSGSGGNINYGTGYYPSIAKFKNYYDGSCKISGFMVYDKALTADEVRQNYLATKERYA